MIDEGPTQEELQEKILIGEDARQLLVSRPISQALHSMREGYINSLLAAKTEAARLEGQSRLIALEDLRAELTSLYQSGRWAADELNGIAE